MTDQPTTEAAQLKAWLDWAGTRMNGVPAPSIIDRIENKARAEGRCSMDDALRVHAQSPEHDLAAENARLCAAIGLALDQLGAPTPDYDQITSRIFDALAAWLDAKP